MVDFQGNHKAAGWDQGDRVSSSSRMWEKGDYFAIREVTLSYDLKGTQLNNYFENIHFFLTGSNLALFNDYSGSSPEEAGGGNDLGRFPTPRTFTFGVNVTF